MFAVTTRRNSYTNIAKNYIISKTFINEHSTLSQNNKHTIHYFIKKTNKKNKEELACKRLNRINTKRW